MRKGFVVLAAALAACATPATSKERAVKIRDEAAPFFAFWDKAKDVDLTTRVALFQAEVVPQFPEFYAYRFQSWRERGKDPDAELAAELSRPPALVERMREVEKRMGASLERDVATFRAALPDFRDDVEVVLVHSLGECDGGVRFLEPDRPTFLLGVDVIARLHEGADDTPFLHHELFHLYHVQWFHPGEEPGFPQRVIHTSAWMEGLATYASQVLNPAATPRDLLLDTPPGSFAACETRRRELAAALLADLRSESSDVYAKWFLLGGAGDQPKRAGYYLGWSALRRIGATRSLAELARLEASQFVPLLEEALVAIRDEAR